jgi:hypothetical protein
MYNDDISLLNPTLNVNDQNVNVPLEQLKENTDYLLAFNNGNRQLLPLIFGNLWDYTTDGKRFLFNGGKFDSYKKCQVWAALNNFNVVNDSRIIFDSVGQRMVYTETLGVANAPSPAWLEREIFIPESLRGQQVLLALKAAGSSALAAWSTANALTETIGVEIIGATQTIQEFFNVGAVPNFYYYNAGRNAPEMTTVYVPFNIALDTVSVKVKVFRTTATGFLHIDRVFVGGLTLPYDSYSIQNLDINEFYDYAKGETKINASTVLGHYPGQTPTIFGGTLTVSGANKSDLVTYEGLIHFMREVFDQNSVIDVPVASITSTSGFNYLDLSQGYIDLVPGVRVYEIDHGTIRAGTKSKPQVNVVAPNIPAGQITGSSNTFYIHSLFDITQSSFKVVLSDSPTITGYQLSWSIGNTFSPLDAVGYMPVTTSIDPQTTGNSIVFDYEQINGG